MESVTNRRKKKRRQRKLSTPFKKPIAPKQFDYKSGKSKCKSNFFHKSRKFTSFVNSTTMDANTFWQNYNIAQEWQNKHNATWWKTKCFALEHENQMLRNAMRKMTLNSAMKNKNNSASSVSATASEDEIANNIADENFEFCVDEDMISFLTQSLQHKRELQDSKDSLMETAEASALPVETNHNSRAENAKELYGEASSLIMAMETAVQASVERHKDKAKPQYWPNIPFRP